MNKFYRLFFVFLILLSGCNPKPIRDNNISQSIDSFNMNIFSNKGKKIFTIKSPNSIYDKENNIIRMEKTTIHSYNDDEAEYIINSDQSRLSDNNNMLELTGNVFLQTLLQEDDKIYANSFKWDINNSEYLLTGNVKFENKEVILSSNKAILNNSNDIIEFFNPVKYIIKNSKNRDIYEINSENAYYNINTKTVSFTSVDDKVRSKLYF